MEERLAEMRARAGGQIPVGKDSRYDPTQLEEYTLQILQSERFPEKLSLIQMFIIPDILENFCNDKDAMEVVQRFVIRGGVLDLRDLKKIYNLSQHHEWYKRIYNLYMDDHYYDEAVTQHIQELMAEKAHQ